MSAINKNDTATIFQEAKATSNLSLDQCSLIGSAVVEMFCQEETAEAYVVVTDTFPNQLNSTQKYRLLNFIIGKLGNFNGLSKLFKLI